MKLSNNPLLPQSTPAELVRLLREISRTVNDNADTTSTALDGKQTLDSVLTAISDGTLGAFSHRNKIINGGFAINQAGYVSGAAVPADLYGHDMWKMAAAGDTYTYSTTANKTTVTIPAGKVLRQIVEGVNLQSGTYVLSWEGTAQGKIGAGAYGASGITGSITGGTNATLEWAGPGTVTMVQFETGTVPTPFEDRPYSIEEGLCQRYYYRINSTGLGNRFGHGHATTTGIANVLVVFKKSMRIPPAALYQSGAATDYDVFTGSPTVCSAVPAFNAATREGATITCSVASGLTAGEGAYLRSQNASAYLAWSARL